MKKRLLVLAALTSACLLPFVTSAADPPVAAKKTLYRCDTKLKPPKCYKINEDGTPAPLPPVKDSTGAPRP